MFPSLSTQGSQSEVSQDESNLKEHEDAARSIEKVYDKNVNCENEVTSTDIRANLEVQTSSDGEIVKPTDDISADVFGLKGLLSAIRAAKTQPQLLELSMGMDLTEMGLNLNSQGPLFTTFTGPFSELTLRFQDFDYPVPIEYLVHKYVGQKLPELNLFRFKDDIIFLLFYGNMGDFMQLKSAAELYRRNWRFHLEEKVWLCKIPGVTNYIQIGSIERGRYYYFNPWIWRRVLRDFEIDFSKIEPCPNLTPILK